MSAPALVDLFLVEEALENAWAQILNAATPNGITAYAEFSDLQKVTPYVETRLEAEPNNFQHIYKNVRYWSAWKGTLYSRIVTSRGKNSDQHRELLGLVRATAQQFDTLFSTDVLPYHSVKLLKEGRVTRGTDPTTFLDWSELTHTVEFFIRGDAWPA